MIEWELADADALNPFNSSSANANDLEEHIYQRLIGIDVKTMKYDIPVLADSMPVVSPDHLQYDFVLRKDIKWADGLPFTGADVIFSLKALKDPYDVESAQSRVYVDPIDSAMLINGDPYHVRFVFSKPYFLAIPAIFGSTLYILPKHLLDPKDLTDHYSWQALAVAAKNPDSIALSKPEKQAMQQFATWFSDAKRNRDPQYVLGTGPYKLDAWVTNQYTRLVRNPYYVNQWGPEFEANPDILLYKTINDFNAAATALKSHDVDLLGDIPSEFWVRIDTNHNELKRTAFPLGQFAYIGFNEKSPLFSDPAVRWAMAYMINRPMIIKKLLFGMAKLTQSPVPSTRPEHDSDLPIIPFDPAKAEHILDSLGWKDHDGDGIRDKVINGKRIPFKFTFTVNAGNNTRMQVLLIYAEALKKIGIDASVNTLEWSVYLERLRDHLLDAHLGGWITDPYEADEYQLYHSSQSKNGGSNADSYSDPKADKLMVDIRQEFDPVKRLAMERQLQEIMYQDQANLFLWEPLNTAAWLDRFDSVTWNGYHPGYNAATWKVRGAASGGAKATF